MVLRGPGGCPRPCPCEDRPWRACRRRGRPWHLLSWAEGRQACACPVWEERPWAHGRDAAGCSWAGGWDRARAVASSPSGKPSRRQCRSDGRTGSSAASLAARVTETGGAEPWRRRAAPRARAFAWECLLNQAAGGRPHAEVGEIPLLHPGFREQPVRGLRGRAGGIGRRQRAWRRRAGPGGQAGARRETRRHGAACGAGDGAAVVGSKAPRAPSVLSDAPSSFVPGAAVAGGGRRSAMGIRLGPRRPARGCGCGEGRPASAGAAAWPSPGPARAGRPFPLSRSEAKASSVTSPRRDLGSLSPQRTWSVRPWTGQTR